jgi:hypothetical protein
LRVGRASASKFPPTKIDKTLKNWNIYTEILNDWTENLNYETSKYSAKTALIPKKPRQTEAATNTI